MIIHLTEDNFYSPVTGEMYKIFVMDDSSAIKVESPVLLKELREKAKPIAGEIKSLPLIPAFSAYFDTLVILRYYEQRPGQLKEIRIFLLNTKRSRK